MPSGSSVLIQDVSKVFAGSRGRAPVQTLKNVSLAVEPGQFVAIIGPSGCGKSTLLSMIAGYTPIEQGVIRVGDRKVTAPGPDRVMVFQRPTLFPWLSAAQNVAFGLRLAVNAGRDVGAAVRSLLDLVNLGQFADHYPYELSGGMQQRVEIARALAVNPQVLLMDEPFGALDALTRRDMQLELSRIHAETGCTTVLVTHDVYEALILADRVVVMGPRPAEILEILTVDMDREHRRDSPEALGLVRHMSSLLGVPGGVRH